jgi:hypothetical protein
VLQLLREPFTRRARNERWYLILSLPLAIAGFVFTVITVIFGLGMSLSFAGWIRAGVTDPAAWRARGYLALKLPVWAGFAVAGGVWLYGLAFLAFPLWWGILHLLAVRLPGAAWPRPGSWPGGWWLNVGPLYHGVRTLPGTLSLVPAGAALVLAAPGRQGRSAPWTAC